MYIILKWIVYSSLLDDYSEMEWNVKFIYYNICQFLRAIYVSRPTSKYCTTVLPTPVIIVRRVNKCNENDYYLNFCIQFCVGILFMCLFC
jgi:hypothetical protein